MEKDDIPGIEKKTEEKTEENIPKISLDKKQNRQLGIAVFLIIAIFFIIIVVPIGYNFFFNKFESAGLQFQKTRFGQLDFYSAKIPVTNVLPTTGKSVSIDDATGKFEINLRNDPRTLDDVKIYVPNNEIKFISRNPVYISIQSDAPMCRDNTIAVAELAAFLTDFANLKVKGALDNKSAASASGFPYRTCNDSGNFNTIIMIRNGNESSIRQLQKNCYEIQYKDCDINRAAEKFILVVLEKYMSYFEEKNSDSGVFLNDTNTS